MSFVSSSLASAKARPATGQAPFGVEEIFFSRTDGRGVIEAFNSVFLRIAAFAPQEMLGAPHRIIRHDDMPKAVFWLLWKAIQAGQPIGAYVKNRAKDGLYYWVFAVVMPIDGGYLSVRLKPTSAMLEVVEREYDALRMLERQESLKPEAAAKLLLDRLAELGFPSYSNFQAVALSTEIAARDAAIGLDADERLKGMVSLLQSVSSIRKGQSGLAQYFHRMLLMPTNLRIIAAKIEPTVGPISAISDNYRTMSGEVMEHLAAFSAANSAGSILDQRPEEHGLFVLCAARLMETAVQIFAEDKTPLDGVDAAAESAILEQMEAKYHAEAVEAMRKTALMAGRMVRDADVLRRAILGLDSIRIMCRVEGGRLVRQSEGLNSMIGNLDEFHSRLNELLDGISDDALHVADDANMVLKAGK